MSAEERATLMIVSSKGRPVTVNNTRKILSVAIAAGLTALLAIVLSVVALTRPAGAATDLYAGYDRYLTLSGCVQQPNSDYLCDGDGIMLPQDARQRAIEGCGKTFPTNSLDAILAAAYRPHGVCD